MSMSISDRATGIEYAGGRGAGGRLRPASPDRRPRFLGVLGQVARFHRRAAAFLAATDDADLTSLGDFLDSEGFSPEFRRLYAVPLVSCVWSTGAQSSLQYPARYLFRFLEQHGMLSFRDSPRWSTVVGGSRTYVDAIADRLDRRPRGPADPGITRGSRRRTGDGRRRRDGLLRPGGHRDPRRHRARLAGRCGSGREGGARPPSSTRATRQCCTPTRRCCRGRRGPGRRGTSGPPSRPADDRPPVVSYWMNRLHGLDSDTQFLVTLNARERIDPAAVLAVMDYRHPVYDAAAVAAQTQLAGLDHRSHRLRRGLPRVGLPRGRLPLGRRGRRRVRSRLVTTTRATCRRCRRSSSGRSGTGAGSRSGTRSGTAPTSGSSTLTTCRDSRPGCGRSPSSTRSDHLGDRRAGRDQSPPSSATWLIRASPSDPATGS